MIILSAHSARSLWTPSAPVVPVGRCSFVSKRSMRGALFRPRCNRWHIELSFLNLYFRCSIAVGRSSLQIIRTRAPSVQTFAHSENTPRHAGGRLHARTTRFLAGKVEGRVTCRTDRQHLFPKPLARTPTPVSIRNGRRRARSGKPFLTLASLPVKQACADRGLVWAILK